MNLVDLKYFKAVADEMSFSKAAERHFISQQAISQHILKLEEYYSIKLFERVPKLKLTQAGKLLYDMSATILMNEEEIKSKMSNLRSGDSGVLSVGAPQPRSTIIMPELFPIFHEKFPNVTLRVTEGDTTSLKDKLIKKEIDFLIVGSLFEDDELAYKEISTQDISLYVSKNVVKKYCKDADMLTSEPYWRGKKPISFSYFKDCPLMYYLPNHRVRKATDNALNQAHAHTIPILETSNPLVLQTLVSKDIGASIISNEIVNWSYFPDEVRDNICRFTLTELNKDVSIKLYYRRDMYFTDYHNAFASIAEEVFKKIRVKR